MNVKQQQEEQVQEKEERKHYMCHFLSSTNNQLCSTHKNIMFISNNNIYFLFANLVYSYYVMMSQVFSKERVDSLFDLDLIYYWVKLRYYSVNVLGQRIGIIGYY